MFVIDDMEFIGFIGDTICPYQRISANGHSVDIQFPYLCIVGYSRSVPQSSTASCQACRLVTVKRPIKYQVSSDHDAP